MCIFHQYHKASGLKSCTAMCRRGKWGRLQGEDHNLGIHNVLFGSKYDSGIFLLTKSAAVR